MAVAVPTGPDSGPRLVRRALGDLRTRGEAALAAGAATITPPMALYSISLERVAERGGGAETSAVHYGWRYIVQEGDRPSLVDLTRREAILRVAAVQSGEAAERLAEAAVAAERAADGEGDFEARILDLAPLSLSALWLYSPAGSLALDLAGEELRVQTIGAFLSEAQARARNRLAAAAGLGPGAEEEGG